MVAIFVTSRVVGNNAAEDTIAQAFAGKSPAKSGRVDADLKLSLSGVPAQLASPFDMKIGGVFQDQAGKKLPDLDLAMTMAAAGQNVQLNVVSTGDKMYIGFQGRHYQVPQRQLDQFVANRRASGADSAALFKALGVNPADWVTNESDEGTASIDGVLTKHVAADVDVARMLDDVSKIASEAPDAVGASGNGITSQELDTIRNAVKGAKLDVFVGKSDDVLRRVELNVAFELKPAPVATPIKGGAAFVMNLSEINKREVVVAPKKVHPFHQLESDLQVGSLFGGNLGSFGAGGTSTAPPPRVSGHPTPRGAARPGGTAAKGAEGYLQCVQQAGSATELERCADLLNR